MTRPIKFRGRFWHKDDLIPACSKYKDGEFIYGGYARIAFQLDDGEGDYIIDGEGEAKLVHPDSVAQLVGYDCNGNEVYEGDELTDNRADIYDEEVTAILKPHIRHNKAGDDTTSMSAFFDRFWGKELVQDWQVKLKEVAK